MSWENSIFNEDRSPLDSWNNRDEDTHMHITEEMDVTLSDLIPYRELSQWEKDLVEAAFHSENFIEQ